MQMVNVEFQLTARILTQSLAKELQGRSTAAQEQWRSCSLAHHNFIPSMAVWIPFLCYLSVICSVLE